MITSFPHLAMKVFMEVIEGRLKRYIRNFRDMQLIFFLVVFF